MSSGVSLNAPPDAVIINLDTVARSPRTHCQIALGSLSRGIRSTPSEFAREVTISPAITIVSLLASAICLRAEIAARVGAMATCPVVAVTTMSTSSWQTSLGQVAHSLTPFASKTGLFILRAVAVDVPGTEFLYLPAQKFQVAITGERNDLEQIRECPNHVQSLGSHRAGGAEYRESFSAIVHDHQSYTTAAVNPIQSPIRPTTTSNPIAPNLLELSRAWNSRITARL